MTEKLTKPVCDVKTCTTPATVLFCVPFAGDASIMYRCDLHKPNPEKSKAITYPIQPDETADGLTRLRQAAVRAYFERH